VSARAETPGPTRPIARSRVPSRRLIWWGVGLAAVIALVYLMATAETGPTDPTEAAQPPSHGTVVFNSGMIVFREGLEAVLILAALTASFVGANRDRRKPVFLGALASFGAAIVTWFAVEALLDVASPLGPKLEAITGFIAIIVLLLVLNWFVHKVYWSEWIGRHHRQRSKVLAKTGIGATLGLVALGFTAVYREGFEVVLFEQNLKLQEGSSAVLEGIALGLVLTGIVGLLTFWLHHKLPYRKMLILTGVLVALVLFVMIGGTALSFAELGWIPQTPTPFDVPEWMGSWFEIYPYWETIGAQVLAVALVVGSYFAAEYVKDRRPRAQGREPTSRKATEAPISEAEAEVQEIEASPA